MKQVTSMQKTKSQRKLLHFKSGKVIRMTMTNLLTLLPRIESPGLEKTSNIKMKI